MDPKEDTVQDCSNQREDMELKDIKNQEFTKGESEGTTGSLSEGGGIQTFPSNNLDDLDTDTSDVFVENKDTPFFEWLERITDTELRIRCEMFAGRLKKQDKQW